MSDRIKRVFAAIRENGGWNAPGNEPVSEAGSSSVPRRRRRVCPGQPCPTRRRQIRGALDAGCRRAGVCRARCRDERLTGQDCKTTGEYRG